MNRLSIQERAKILGCLVEGNSIRATSRMTGADKKTVLRLLAEFGEGLTDHVWSLEEIAMLSIQRTITEELKV
jgi:transposase-like protein